MNKKQRKGFTLVELVAVLVILAVIATIVTPLVLTLIRRSRESAYKRSVDSYGKAIENSVMNELLDTGLYPNDLTALKVEYTGYEVVCNIMNLNIDGSIYLSECTVDGEEVKDSTTKDGWYHYGKLKRATMVQTLLKKANDATVTAYDASSEISQQMYTFTHSATTQTDNLTDYRYIGSNPYNYVTFNDELWRIIGVFTVEDETGEQTQRVKIMKDASIGKYAWNSNGTNEWPGSSLQTYLNGDYYNSLSTYSKDMIESVKFYLGGGRTYAEVTAEDYYTFERGNLVYSGRSTNWTGKVGLMYLSDYAYSYANGVDSTCYSNVYLCRTNKGGNPSLGWMFNAESQSVLYPYSNSSSYVYRIMVEGHTYYDGGVKTTRGVRPTVYLASNVYIDSGDGSETSPYQIKVMD